GPILVRAAHWLSHLEYDWESPVWRHWIEFLAGNFRTIRFDERGCGLSDWTTGSYSLDQWVSDLDAVITATGVKEPVTLLGVSQGGGTCIAYALAHPERVARLILYGAYARGAQQRGTSDRAHEYA